MRDPFTVLGVDEAAKGRLVYAGLIDIHANILVNASDMAGHTDDFCRAC
jgi:hypothetical protein